MSWSATIGEHTFTEANLDGNAYAEEETGFPAIIRAIAEETAALKGVAGLSVSPRVPARGSVFLELLAPPPGAWRAGQVLRVSSAGAADHCMVGTISARDGTGLTLDIAFAAGTSERADWVLTYPLFSAFLEKAGGALTGELVRDGMAGGERGFGIDSGGVRRWTFGGNTESESGGNSGTAFFINRHDDTGALLGQALHVDRATGAVTLGGMLDLSGQTLAGATLDHTRMRIGVPDVQSGMVAITADSANALEVTLNGDVTFDFRSIGPGHEYTRRLRIGQGGAGGFVPAWQVDGAGADVRLRNPSPDYAAQGAGTVTWATVQVWGTELHVWQSAEE